MTYKNDFIRALLKEIHLQKEYFEGDPVETIYLGGGTPSLLDQADLESLLNTLYQTFPISAGAELTLEANPDDIVDDKLLDWKKSGINRLSIGIQSFFEEDLRWMNRAHTVSQARNSVLAARKNGFEDISIDLIYGTPTLPDKHWKENVEEALLLGVPHLSCYALTVEPRTPLNKMIAEKRMAGIDPEQQARQFLALMDWMRIAGYDHYEISNFALPGKRSRHNSSYWQGKKYLGLGPSAHSYNGRSRQWNMANNNRYIQSLERNELLFEEELLTNVQVLNEYIMTAIRTMEGIRYEKVRQGFGSKAMEMLIAKAEKYILNQMAREENDALILTKDGKLLADGIAAALFFEPQDQVFIPSDVALRGNGASPV